MVKSDTHQHVTIRDVAQLAGVSPATVSKVLNDGPYVSAAARQRVVTAIAKLNYRPNAVARSLKAKRTLTIGLITDDLEGVFTASMMRGIEEATNAQGFSVLLCNSYGRAERERADLKVLFDKRVDGIILMSGYRVRERSAPALPLGDVPCVYLYQYTHDLDVPCVIPDDFGGSLLAMRHALHLGHRHIGFISGPHHYEATQWRLDAYRAALDDAGIAFDPSLVRVGKWYESSGYRLAQELMSLSHRPTALVCCSDSLAAGALDAMLEAGIRVPDEVTVIGFDNRHFAAHQHPPLTTVALPLQEMGRLAGELLVSAIRGEHANAQIIKVSCALVVRKSSGPRRQSAIQVG